MLLEGKNSTLPFHESITREREGGGEKKKSLTAWVQRDRALEPQTNQRATQSPTHAVSTKTWKQQLRPGRSLCELWPRSHPREDAEKTDRRAFPRPTTVATERTSCLRAPLGAQPRAASPAPRRHGFPRPTRVRPRRAASLSAGRRALPNRRSRLHGVCPEQVPASPGHTSRLPWPGRGTATQPRCARTRPDVIRSHSWRGARRQDREGGAASFPCPLSRRESWSRQQPAHCTWAAVGKSSRESKPLVTALP